MAKLDERGERPFAPGRYPMVVVGSGPGGLQLAYFLRRLGVEHAVLSADAAGVHMDVSPETVRVSALGSLKRGVSVNLERPMRADARVGGHFVQGHVDATGSIEELRHYRREFLVPEPSASRDSAS